MADVFPGVINACLLFSLHDTGIKFFKPTRYQDAGKLKVIEDAADARSKRDGRILQRVLEKVRQRRDPQRRVGDPATGRITPVQMSDNKNRAAQSLAGIFRKRVVFIRNDCDLEKRGFLRPPKRVRKDRRNGTG